MGKRIEFLNHGRKLRIGPLERKGSALILLPCHVKLDEGLHFGLENLSGNRFKNVVDGIALTLKLDDNLPLIAGNPVRLEQVIINLLANARDSLVENERVDRKIEISTHQMSGSGPHGESSVAIEVRDNGPGVPDAVRLNIFEPFFTTKPAGKGTGLGLSIAASVLKQHGGEMQLESSPDTGTVFRLLLPLPMNH